MRTRIADVFDMRSDAFPPPNPTFPNRSSIAAGTGHHFDAVLAVLGQRGQRPDRQPAHARVGVARMLEQRRQRVGVQDVAAVVRVLAELLDGGLREKEQTMKTQSTGAHNNKDAAV